MFDLIPKFYALQHIKTIFHKTTRTTNDWGYKPMSGVISGVFIPKDKTKSQPLTTEKVTIIKVTKFLVFPSVIKREFSLPKGYQHQSMEVK